MRWSNARNGGLGLALALAAVACASDDEACGGSSCGADAGSADVREAFDAGAADARTNTPEDAGTTPMVPPECSSGADCALPDGLLACRTCDDDSVHCPKAECVDGHCATLLEVCPEQQPVPACTSDGDCRSPGCDLLCQGDGRSTCLPSRCRDGACVEVRGTCDLRPSSCPSGNRAGVLCGSCGDAGSCAFKVIGCFEACESDADCPTQQPCDDGVCVPAPACG